MSMELFRDLRFGLRTLSRNPTASLVCILTLALGIGANTAIFSVLEAVVLRPLPYPDSGRLVQLQMTYSDSPGARFTYYSGPVFLALREQLRSFDSLAALYTYSPEGYNLNLDGRSQRISRLKVSSDYFQTLGVQPMLGRVFTREEELLRGPPDPNRSASKDPPRRLVILSHGLWQELLGAEPNVLGESILLSGTPYTVIGVMPAGFRDPLVGHVDVWVPHNLSPGGYNNKGNSYLTVLGRVSRGVPLERARQELITTMQALVQEKIANSDDGAEMESLQSLLIGDLDSTLYILLGAVAILLLIACVNVANLQLSHYAARSRELAVRAAVGGSPARLTRQLLTENLLLVLFGGIAGVGLAILGVRFMLRLAPAGLLETTSVSINASVLLFTAAVALSTGLLFGLAPAWRSSRIDIERILRQSTRGSAAGGRWAGRLLVIGQISLSMILLVAAALLLMSYRGLLDREGDIRSERVYTFRVDLSNPSYRQPEARVRFYDQLHEALLALPGVESAGAISKLPLTGPYHNWGFQISGRDPESEQAWGSGQIRVVDGGYFRALEIPLIRGRLPAPSDRAGSPPVILVNRRLAAQYFEGEDVLGRTLNLAGEERTVIGIVEDVRITHILPAPPKVYIPHSQFADNRVWDLDQVVATRSERSDIFSLIRAQVTRLDPNLAIFSEAPLDEIVAAGVAQQRFATTLMTLFGLLALILAVVGIHGVLTQILGSRTREFAIRMALGAGIPQMLRIVFLETLVMAGAGTLLGLAGGVVATRWIESLLYEISPSDPRAFLVVVFSLLFVALLVALIPARRVLRLRPVEILRNE